MGYQDLDHIRRAYQGYQDEKIIKIAKAESRGLRNEVVPILIAEIEARQLNSNLKDYVFANRRRLSKLEKEVLIGKVKGSTCSLCKKNRDLAGYRIVSITGLIVDTISIEQNLIVCEACGIERYRRASRHTMMLGWWSLLGIIQTSGEVLDKTKRFIRGREVSQDQIIGDFLNEYLVPITLSNDDAKVIDGLVGKYNQRELNQ